MPEQEISAAKLVATLRKLPEEVEILWIEREIYREMVELYAITVPGLLKTAVEEALADPKRRQEARRAFRAMRAALEEPETAAYPEESSAGLPPSGKPN